jgi:hypothetical protein
MEDDMSDHMTPDNEFVEAEASYEDMTNLSPEDEITE